MMHAVPLSFEELQQELKAKGIHLSHQRLKVVEYLAQHQCHPTVDQIFTALQKDIPTLSKTTVYNTLRVLVKAGLVRAITIEDNQARYDVLLKDHGHFKCEACGKIYDFCIDTHALASRELERFQIRDKNVYFRGVCPDCLKHAQ